MVYGVCGISCQTLCVASAAIYLPPAGWVDNESEYFTFPDQDLNSLLSKIESLEQNIMAREMMHDDVGGGHEIQIHGGLFFWLRVVTLRDPRRGARRKQQSRRISPEVEGIQGAGPRICILLDGSPW